MSDPEPAQRRVLVVDDQVGIRSIVSAVLTPTGFHVLEAASADEALVLLQRHPNLLVLITNVDMPGSMDGLDLAHRVRKRDPNIGIVVVSGRARNTSKLPVDAVFIPKSRINSRMFVEQVSTLADQAKQAGP
jgi:CheY-like chemotaxis protein